MSSQIKWEGPSLVVIQLRNKLRRQSHSELLSQPAVTTTVQNFRGEPVCIAVARAVTPAGVAVLVRGFVPGGQVLQEAGFLKLTDERWQRLSEELKAELRAQLEHATPTIDR